MSTTVPSETSSAGPIWGVLVAILTVVISGAVAFLVWGPRPSGAGTLDVSWLPTVNASLNAATTVLLVIGGALAFKRRIQAHRWVMLGAFAMSAAFLVSYVLYHWFSPGPKEYVGDFRTLYLFILVTHIVLASIIVPLALVTLGRGWRDERARHRKIARITLPLWLYVSVTGVVIYGMLYL